MSDEGERFLEGMRLGRLRRDEALRKAFGPGLAPDPYDHRAYMKVVTKALRERARPERPAAPSAWYQFEEGVAASIRKLLQEVDDVRYPFAEWEKKAEEGRAAFMRKLLELESPMLESLCKTREEEDARRASGSPVDHPEPD